MNDPTGLDYHAAYQAIFPGLFATVRIQDLPDDRLKTVDRAARLRRAERERVKKIFLDLAVRLETYPDDNGIRAVIADLIRETAEEIR